MTPTILFEHERDGQLWRLEVTEYRGRRFLNWRKWYRPDGGDWTPTKSGVTIPLERLPELAESIGAYLAGSALSGAENRS